MSERRKFTRIPFDATVKFQYAGKSWACDLVDISLQGALIETPENWLYSDDELISFSLNIGEEGLEVTFQGKIAHTENRQIGVRIEHIDIDSASHLKRLVELNLGDAILLSRELHALC